MRFIVLGAAIVLAAAGTAQSASEGDFQLETAGALANLCASTADPAAIHMCQGYLVGVHQMHDAIAEAAGRGVYCIGDNSAVTRDSAAADFVTWMEANPSKAAMSARDGLLEFAFQTYPCN